MPKYIPIDDDDDSKLVITPQGKAVHPRTGKIYRLEEETSGQNFGSGFLIGFVVAIFMLIFPQISPFLASPIIPGTPGVENSSK